MTHAEAIETIKNGGATVRLLVKRGKAPPPAILGRQIRLRISNSPDIGYSAGYKETFSYLPTEYNIRTDFGYEVKYPTGYPVNTRSGYRIFDQTQS